MYVQVRVDFVFDVCQCWFGRGLVLFSLQFVCVFVLVVVFHCFSFPKLFLGWNKIMVMTMDYDWRYDWGINECAGVEWRFKMVN